MKAGEVSNSLSCFFYRNLLMDEVETLEVFSTKTRITESFYRVEEGVYQSEDEAQLLVFGTDVEENQ